MRIAFDLDDTLIPTMDAFPVDRPKGLFGRLLAIESLRRGTAPLFRQLQAGRCETWIYTTSLRSRWYVRQLFGWYGIAIHGVINRNGHARRVRKFAAPLCSSEKYPPAFGIDLLVDNSEGIEYEAELLGYRVLRIRPDDLEWVQIVLDAVRALRQPIGL